MDLQSTKLDYFDDMQKLQSTATILSHIQEGEENRHALILDSTIFHPQGGGQPSDTGFITNVDCNLKFVVQDVRLKDGIVFHYGIFNTQEGFTPNLESGQEVCLQVDEQRRVLNSRLHSAGHLLDICMKNVGLAYLEPGKGYHFPDGPFVEYKGTIAQNELQNKQKELEMEANKLISNGGKVFATVLPYAEAAEMCGGSLPAYISESSTPRILKLGNNPGCPCGGTHVADIADIRSFKQDHNTFTKESAPSHSQAMLGKTTVDHDGELNVSFGYQCTSKKGSFCKASDVFECPTETYEEERKIRRRSSSFSCLSGAALSANATLANTNLCNGLIGSGILPGLDSPKSFRRVPSSQSFSRLDILSSSYQSNNSTLSGSLSTSQSESFGWDSILLESMSAPSRSEGFLNAVEVQIAGGAAGEDRVQAVCSEEKGWVFCSIYDGFNGRDAADFLAGTLYESIGFYLNLLDWPKNQQNQSSLDDSNSDGSLLYFLEDGSFEEKLSLGTNTIKESVDITEEVTVLPSARVLENLQRALGQAESEFLNMVEQEMDDRPDLVSVGSCVLVVLLHGKDLYTLNLGDSRAVLATSEGIHTDDNDNLVAVQLTDSHNVDNETERMQLLCDHPDDPLTIVAGRVKGKLRVTRAFGVGYLKKRNMNDALMGILRVRNLVSPPYISSQPSLNVHRISKGDRFVILGSDGLFDFFSNDEAVKLVHLYILSNPSGDPAKYLLEQLVARAAENAGFTMEELMSIPAGSKRKYHDDVTVIVIILGSNQRTMKASTYL